MKIEIFANDAAKSVEVKRQLEKKLAERHFVFDSKNPDIVITVGGDGTLLAAFHHYESQLEKIRFVGVHTGHLGFYTDWRDDEIDDLVISLQSDNRQSVSYPLLDVSVKTRVAGEIKQHLALNESSLRRVGPTMTADVFIGGDAFERFRGDGLCIATPTGSTGYSKSLGGAVIHPDLPALQLTEIGSINNRVFRTLSSPLVISPNDWVTLVPVDPSSSEDFLLTVDSSYYHSNDIAQVSFKISKKKIHFAKYRHNGFWNRVKNSFIGDGK
ncbi:ATP-NAD kinase [Ligilactobacillus salitolerans]|uniref:NAD kinase n=1 Tax=Ligilactobacillus salitolerans TaxID=1808352 RepID=A0A401IVT8_9LACO|nr:NAD kinase [Ligilactobacillus salitolerans]GBG95654.1 ATP-NAD kinase [Ligilactobacillus salitolerans]